MVRVKDFQTLNQKCSKYGRNNMLIESIGKVIETIIKYSVAPYLFNIYGIIKPFIKDNKKAIKFISSSKLLTIVIKKK